MFRTIYQEWNKGYSISNSLDYKNVPVTNTRLIDGNKKIICIVDFKYKVFLYKCEDYEAHRAKIEHHLFME